MSQAQLFKYKHLLEKHTSIYVLVILIFKLWSQDYWCTLMKFTCICTIH